MQVVGLADGVENAVRVRARGRVEEGEGAFRGIGEGIEADGGKEGRLYNFGGLWGCVGSGRLGCEGLGFVDRDA